MPWADLAATTVALLAYPGLMALLVAGAMAELVAAWALVPESGGPLPAARSVWAGLRPGPAAARRLPPLAGTAAIMTLLAATQIAAPYNLAAPAQRNVLVVAMALATASWLAWGWGAAARELDLRLLLAVQMCWLLAVLATAVVPQNLRPQVLGAVQISRLLPLKFLCGALYLLCLPVLLQLLPESAPQGLPGATRRSRPTLEGAGFSVLRVLLWLPCCGLFASLFFAPSGDDLGGLLRFAIVSAGAAGVAIAIAAQLVRRPSAVTRAFYLRLAVPLAGFTVVVTLGTAILNR